MKLKILAAAVAAALLMTACGANTPAPPVEAPSAPESAAEAAPSQPEAPAESSEGSPREEEASGDVDEELPPENETRPAPGGLTIGAAKSSGAIGLVQLMNENSEGGSYHFTLTDTPDELTGGIIQGEYDFAVVPVDLAAKLFQTTNADIQMAAVGALGALYIVEKGDTVQSAEDLRGRTIHVVGQGSATESVLNCILTKNGLTPGTDVTVEYSAGYEEASDLLAAGEADLALVTQTAIVGFQAQNPGLRTALDLSEEWDKASDDGSRLTMDCLVVQKRLIRENPQAVDAFLLDYRNSINFVKDPENVSVAAGAMEYFHIVDAETAERMLPQCRLTFIRGDKMKEAVDGFLQALRDAAPKAEEETLPGDGFYYGIGQ